jgi:hypothetical protein
LRCRRDWLELLGGEYSGERAHQVETRWGRISAHEPDERQEPLVQPLFKFFFLAEPLSVFGEFLMKRFQVDDFPGALLAALPPGVQRENATRMPTVTIAISMATAPQPPKSRMLFGTWITLTMIGPRISRAPVSLWSKPRTICKRPRQKSSRRTASKKAVYERLPDAGAPRHRLVVTRSNTTKRTTVETWIRRVFSSKGRELVPVTLVAPRDVLCSRRFGRPVVILR